MISCNHYDYIEIACMHRLNIELVLKNGDSVCGVAADIKRNFYSNSQPNPITLSIRLLYLIKNHFYNL